MWTEASCFLCFLIHCQECLGGPIYVCCLLLLLCTLCIAYLLHCFGENSNSFIKDCESQIIQMGPDEPVLHFFCLDIKKILFVLFCTLFQYILLLIISLRLLFRSQAYVLSHASKLCCSSSRCTVLKCTVPSRNVKYRAV